MRLVEIAPVVDIVTTKWVCADASAGFMVPLATKLPSYSRRPLFDTFFGSTAINFRVFPKELSSPASTLFFPQLHHLHLLHPAADLRGEECPLFSSAHNGVFA